MGHRDKNFHTQAMTANGYGDAAERIQELFLAGRKEEAVAAVPDEFIDEGALVGPGTASASASARGPTAARRASPSATQQDEAMELMADLAAVPMSAGPDLPRTEQG